MAIFVNPFDTILDIIDNALLFGIKLAPAISDWIESNIPAHKQHEIVVRMKHCYRLCKRFKLTPDLVHKQVNVLFSDFTTEQKDDVWALLSAWLIK